jgi:hypothetical protein
VFGIVKPCRHRLSAELHQEWVAHQCGLCLSLREHADQRARLTTNTDAIVLSVLVDAQRERATEMVTAAPCPLRGMRTAPVVGAGDPAAVHAAAVSLTMAATKLADHARDGDGAIGRVPRLAGGVSRRWATQGDDLAGMVGFDAAVVRAAVAESDRREDAIGLSFADYVAPTEDAAAAACRHTAVLAGRLDNVAALDTVGRMFGRLTYLFDAYDDQVEDEASGHFNALVACFPAPSRAEAARALYREAYATLVEAFDSLHLVRGALARALLVDEIGRVGRQRFGHAPSCDAGRHEPTCRQARADVGVLAGLGVAAAGALAVGLRVFRPGDEQPPPMMPPPGMPPPGMPPYGMPPQGEPAKQHWYSNCFDGGDCCCCCCECGDCCDCCDC